jgi:hypothetical protein
MKLYTCLYDRLYSFIALMVRYDEPPPFPHTKIAAIAIPVDILRICCNRILKRIQIKTKVTPFI